MAKTELETTDQNESCRLAIKSLADGIFLYDMSNTTQLVMPANDMTGAVI